MTGLGWAALATPVGDVSVGCTGEGVARVRFGRHRQTAGGAGLGPAAALAERACQQLAEYFAGHRRAFTLPVDWAAALGEHASGPSARQRVLAVLADTVGYGQTVTYGALASRAGFSPGASFADWRPVVSADAPAPAPARWSTVTETGATMPERSASGFSETICGTVSQTDAATLERAA